MKEVKVTFLGHSGFFVEWANCYCLFDYHTGSIPGHDTGKPLYVFVSHAHADHYNRSVWELRHTHPEIQYIVSKDVPLSQGQKVKLGLQDRDAERISRMTADEVCLFPNQMTVKTLRSTDQGVAFLVTYAGKTFFHAGDLNLWTWEGESAVRNADMIRRYAEEMEKLKGLFIDVAFFPLDPRQGEDCGKGLQIFNRTVEVRELYPMHVWGHFEIISQYIAGHPSECGNIVVISFNGQTFHS